jgi:hypothetical protein
LWLIKKEAKKGVYNPLGGEFDFEGDFFGFFYKSASPRIGLAD